MAISDKLTQLNETKQNIKTALENKGIDTSSVAFTDYADKISEIPSTYTGAITNKLNGALIDISSQAENTTATVYTYNSEKEFNQVFYQGHDTWYFTTGYAGSIGYNEFTLDNEAPFTQVISDDLKSVQIKCTTASGINHDSPSYRIYVTFYKDRTYIDSDYFEVIVPLYICYVKGTKILLANGLLKNVEDITYDDELLAWDFDNGCHTSAKPLWIKQPEIATYYYHCTFENGLTLDLTGSSGNCHAVFNLDKNKFEYANKCVGQMVMTKLGASKLLSCEKVDEKVEFYNIMTNYHINCYANEVLTSSKLNNIYPIENMKFVKEDRELIPIESFDGVSEEYYYGLRLGENKKENIDMIIENVKTKIQKTLLY